jgi:5'-3' exoribonuclease 2
MTDENSPIIDFYPKEFPTDLNGKKYAWQGVALLPFIDADRLLKAVIPLYNKLSEDEKRRNTLGHDLLFAPAGHKIFDELCMLYGTPKVEYVIALIYRSLCL